MISFKCKNCAGEMSVDSQGMLFCEYCGSKVALTDKDLQEYRTFRLRVLNYLRGLHDKETEEGAALENIWSGAETAYLKTADGTDVKIRYIYSQALAETTYYVARQSVIFLFNRKQAHNADLYESKIAMIEYPAADMKGLDRSFPRVTGRYAMENGGVMITVERRENVFPLGMFGGLDPVHAAWIVSRLENICCVLEYSQLIHGGINANSVFIDPFSHEAVLYGGWWLAREKKRQPLVNEDLLAIRKTAEYVMGVNKEKMPKQFENFLKELPTKDAYIDFENWDKVIEEGFGGRRFVKMDVTGTNNGQINK